MSDKEVYCEKIIEYDEYSSEIIIQSYKDSIKTKYSSIKKHREYILLKKYNDLYSEYQILNRDLSILRECLYKSKSIDYSIAIKKQMYVIAEKKKVVYNELFELEESAMIQTILNHEKLLGKNIWRNFGFIVDDCEFFLKLEDKFNIFEKNLMKKSEQSAKKVRYNEIFQDLFPILYPFIMIGVVVLISSIICSFI